MIFLRYALWRFITMLLTLWVVSLLVFVIINLPPGDYLSNQIAELRASGQSAGVAKAEFLRSEYALDKPLWQQYFIWVGFLPGPHGFSGLVQGNFGWSFEFDLPVAEIALLLDFDNATNFRRALRRWAGLTPSELRR